MSRLYNSKFIITLDADNVLRNLTTMMLLFQYEVHKLSTPVIKHTALTILDFFSGAVQVVVNASMQRQEAY